MGQLRYGRKRRSVVTLLAAACLVLTGCAGGVGGGSTATDAPAVEPPGPPALQGYEPATSASPALDVPVPRMPGAARQNSEAGLVATVEFWWAAFHYLRVTGDPVPLLRVYDTDCEFCLQQALLWEEIYREGSWAVTSPPEARIESTSYGSDSPGAVVALRLTEGPSQLYEPGGIPARGASFAGRDDEPWVMSLVFDDLTDRWRVEEVRQLTG